MASRRISVLWLAPFLPYPPEHGGAVRIYNLIRNMGRECDISLCTLTSRPATPDAIAALQPHCRSVQTFVRPPRPSFYPPRLAPPVVFLDDVPEMHRAIAALQVAQQFDVLHIEYPGLTPYLAHRGRSATFLTELDVTFMSLYRRFLVERTPRRFLAFATFFYYEWRHLSRYDAVVTMSENDRNTLRRLLPKLNIQVIPNGVDCAYFSPAPRSPAEENLLFVGNFAHPPNVDAVLWFARDAWSALRHSHPALRLLIVGPNPPPEVQTLTGEGITVTGRVPDLREYYAAASAVVVPLRYGSGTRLKVLEAFAAGVPVISTSLGVEGLEVIPGRHFLEANSPDAFVVQIEALLAEPTLWDRLSNQSRRLAEKRYDWRTIADQQMELYRQTIERRKASA